VPACSFDPQKLIEKAAELQSGAPCDATCDPATHCCFDLLGGMGGSGGLPGIPGLGDGGLGVPGGGGTCVTK
jgi:hypothetical protein